MQKQLGQNSSLTRAGHWRQRTGKLLQKKGVCTPNQRSSTRVEKVARRTIEGVEPELESCVLEALDTSLVQLRERQQSSSIDVLVEGSEDDDLGLEASAMNSFPTPAVRGCETYWQGREDEVIKEDERVLEEVLSGKTTQWSAKGLTGRKK